MHVEDVFTTSGIPQYTYVEPKEYTELFDLDGDSDKQIDDLVDLLCRKIRDERSLQIV